MKGALRWATKALKRARRREAGVRANDATAARKSAPVGERGGDGTAIQEALDAMARYGQAPPGLLGKQIHGVIYDQMDFGSRIDWRRDFCRDHGCNEGTVLLRSEDAVKTKKVLIFDTERADGSMIGGLMGCAHGRGVGVPCPHCMGMGSPLPEPGDAMTSYTITNGETP